jgi:hypothetical protein
MFTLKNIVFPFFFSLLIISCASDKSAYVDVPSDHDEELKNSKYADEITVPMAGNYGNILFAIDSNKISALYSDKGRNCYFIESEFTKFSAENTLKWRQVGTNQKGEGKLTVEKDALWIQFSGNPLGCAPELFKSIQKFPITKINNWRKICVVNKNLVEISSEPLEAMKIGQSFKKGDIICILEQKKEWLRVEKIAKSPQVGWIRASELEN